GWPGQMYLAGTHPLGRPGEVILFQTPSGERSTTWTTTVGERRASSIEPGSGPARIATKSLFNSLRLQTKSACAQEENKSNSAQAAAMMRNLFIVKLSS